MNCVNSWPAFIRMTAIAVFLCFVSPLMAQVEIGTRVPLKISTPIDYAGLDRGQEAAVRWRYDLVHPGATYIALHFVNFELGSNDYLVISDDQGREECRLIGKGKQQAGTFWARHVKSDTVILELVVSGPGGGHGFQIDQYAAGFMDPETVSKSVKAICGDDDKGNAVCYQDSHPVEYERSRAVARLLISGNTLCTGWLVSPDNLLLTNEHCITTNQQAIDTDYEFMSEAGECSSENCQLCWQGVVFSGGTLVQDDNELDYALIRIDDGNPASIYGYLEIDDRSPSIGEEIYVPQHPDGRAKEIAMFSSEPADSGGVARVYSVTEPPCSGGDSYDTGYFADTEGGSSGAPVLSRSSQKVIALHHCAGCPNRGVPMDRIHNEIADYLFPGPAGVLRFSRSIINCQEVLGITVRDGDLAGLAKAEVHLTTASGDFETAWLAEYPANSGVFEGSISMVEGVVVHQSSLLEVVHGDAVTGTYQDFDDGTGYPVSVRVSVSVDCESPEITDVTVQDIAGDAAVVVFGTSEPANGAVYLGLSCGGPAEVIPDNAQTTNHQIQIKALEPNTTYFFWVEAEDAAGNRSTDDCGGAWYSFTTGEMPDDYYTQLFTDDNGLGGWSVMFTPDGSANGYGACAGGISELPVDPSGGAVLAVGDDGSEVVSARVSLYGVIYDQFHVGSNGYISFGGADQDYTESLLDHFRMPRISVLFDDLNPPDGSVTWKSTLGGRIVVTWENVPEYRDVGSNTFQVELFGDGRIRISWLELTAADGLVGLSAGQGIPSNFVASDMISYEACQSLIPGDFDGDGDVDMSDFGHLQACYGTSDSEPENVDCLDARMDEDADVDPADYGLFQRCLTGANIPGDPHCLD